MNYRVMVVDDEVNWVTLVSEYLNLKNIKCVGFTSPKLALEFLEKDRQGWIVLLDQFMDEMAGLDWLSRAKLISPKTKIFMVTASNAVPTVVDAMKNGALDFLTKPIELSTLHEKILSIGERSSEASTQPGSIRDQVRTIEAEFIENALQEENWNISKTAIKLKLSRKGLQLKIKSLGLRRPI